MYIKLNINVGASVHNVVCTFIAQIYHLFISM